MYAGFVKSVAPDYPEIEVRLYEAGVDTDYIPKYGILTKSILVINESIAVTNLSKSAIRKAFKMAAKKA